MRPSSLILVGVVKLLVGAYARWVGTQPSAAQRIYFANHTSHIDTLAIWSALPVSLRSRTRPIAARDYWGSGLKRYIATRAFGAVLIDRARENTGADPLEPLRAALNAGDSLIIFPEGTRGTSAVPARFRSGLYRLAEEFPQRRTGACPSRQPAPRTAKGCVAAGAIGVHGAIWRADRASSRRAARGVPRPCATGCDGARRHQGG